MLASLSLGALDRDHSGIAYHPVRESLFLLGRDGQIREIDPDDGSVLAEFPVRPTGGPFFSVDFGGIDVIESTGELLIAAENNARLRMMTPTGSFIQDVDLQRTGVSLGRVSDVSVDSDTGEVLIGDTSGSIYRMSPIVDQTVGTLRLDGDVDVRVAGEFETIGTIQLFVGDRPASGDFATIVADGAVTIDGDLQIYASTTLASEIGDSYRVISGDTLSGEFDNLIATDFETIVDDQAVFAFFQRAPRVDLVPSFISGPANVISGDEIGVQWTIGNSGSDPAVGPWFDEF